MSCGIVLIGLLGLCYVLSELFILYEVICLYNINV